MPLNLIPSDRTIRALKREAAPKRLSDGGGLYLLPFFEGGSHGWRFDFSYAGKRKTISLGTFPDTGLALAREKAQEAREQLARGINPSEARKAAKVEQQKEEDARERIAKGLSPVGSFQAAAEAFHALKWSPDRPEARQWSASYADRWIGRLRLDVFPYIGARQCATITPVELLEVLQRVEQRGAFDTAQKLCQSISEAFRHAIILGYCNSDPARDLRGALRKHVVQHYAAITTPGEARQLMRAMMNYQGRPTTRAALILSALVFQRPGNVRSAEWEHIDLDAAMWSIPSVMMKRRVHQKINGAPHLVPLASQAVDLLRSLKPLTGHGRWVFPNRDGGGCMSENTVRKALHSMGYGSEVMTPHGFRAMARTMLAENTSVPPDVIEAQLAHAKAGPLGAAYDRAEYLAQRRDMMQQWSDYLFSLAAQPVGLAATGP